mmetsp:Transcript_74124/g.131082  ORF Transcript_74124/g.131082 Transcript_74124/m.131082 type:complete len:229 (-) Transcript_74124:24-710(-)
MPRRSLAEDEWPYNPDEDDYDLRTAPVKPPELNDDVILKQQIAALQKRIARGGDPTIVEHYQRIVSELQSSQPDAELDPCLLPGDGQDCKRFVGSPSSDASTASTSFPEDSSYADECNTPKEVGKSGSDATSDAMPASSRSAPDAKENTPEVTVSKLSGSLSVRRPSVGPGPRRPFLGQRANQAKATLPTATARNQTHAMASQRLPAGSGSSAVRQLSKRQPAAVTLM